MNAANIAADSSDNALLQEFARSADEYAFSLLVSRYLGTVYSVAWRRTGDHQLAQEIAQNVFAILARKAGGLSPKTVLAGWLHRAAMIETSLELRREYSRRRRMEKFSNETQTRDSGRDPLAEALPILDQAMDALPTDDRNILLLRFSQDLGFAEIGQQLGKTEDAARKQTSRAVEKLSRSLWRMGATVPAAILGTSLGASVSKAAPLALAESVAHAALASVSTVTTTTLITHTIQAMSAGKLITTTAGVCIMLATIPTVTQWSQNQRLRHEVARLQQMLDARQGAQVVTAAPARAAIPNPATPAATSGVTTVLDRAKALLANHTTLRQADYERLIALLRELSPSQLAQALTEVSTMADADARRWLTEGLVETWGERDPANALAWATEHLSPDGQRRRLPTLISDWAAQDPNAAAKWAQDFTDRRNATLSVYPGLNNTTFDEMARTGNQARALEMRLQESLFQNLGAGFATKDLDTAIETWAKLPTMAQQVAFMDGLSQHLATGEACQKIAQFLVQQSPMENVLANGLGSVSPGGTYGESRALNSVFSTWAAFDRESANRFVENIDDQRTKTILASIVGNQWLESDPVGAANWWLQQTSPDGRGNALEEIARGWAMRDPRATGEWLNQLPAGAERDRGVIAFVGEISLAHPDIAAAWVQTISDPTKREEWVSNLQKLKTSR